MSSKDDIESILTELTKELSERTGGSVSAKIVGPIPINADSTPQRKKPKRPSHEVQVMELLQYAKDYELHNGKAAAPEGFPFQIGQFVTPKASAPTIGHGDPFVVVEVRRAEPYFSGNDTGSNNFGARNNMRILGFAPSNEHVVGWWVESWTYQPWEMPGSSKTAS